MANDSDLLFELELPNEVVIAIQKHVRQVQPYSEMNIKLAFKHFIQDLVIQFIANFQPTEILLKTVQGKNPNYHMYRIILTNDEIDDVTNRVGKGRYFELELKKKLFEVWQSYDNINGLGLLGPSS